MKSFAVFKKLPEMVKRLDAIEKKIDNKSQE
jgi:tetrahydromethanopterin S-methyltransferase subunit G